MHTYVNYDLSSRICHSLFRHQNHQYTLDPGLVIGCSGILKIYTRNYIDLRIEYWRDISDSLWRCNDKCLCYTTRLLCGYGFWIKVSYVRSYVSHRCLSPNFRSATRWPRAILTQLASVSSRYSYQHPYDAIESILRVSMSGVINCTLMRHLHERTRRVSFWDELRLWSFT